MEIYSLFAERLPHTDIPLHITQNFPKTFSIRNDFLWRINSQGEQTTNKTLSIICIYFGLCVYSVYAWQNSEFPYNRKCVQTEMRHNEISVNQCFSSIFAQT